MLETQNLFGHVGGGRFDTLLDAVHAYVHNLNTHPQYEGFRLARSQARAEGEKTLDGDRLAATLRGYSTRGMAYVADLRALMRDNTMASLDGARLGRVTPRRWAQAW
ncbi:Uncharacterized FlgJ-related protein [Pararhodospirillum photometricum DSM 122]|uniref:Uncharacterized FlgJ-related protein n=1 Tax=Pararhodospirillum photometricum DSM 122 TaxID=1150469 RepID=H6SQR7_PARPM|nr:Uncharacterized FlgJ-related protein [Pararhodospirillum photometricum DSM 122]